MTVERIVLPLVDTMVDEVPAAVHRPARPRGAAVLLTHGAGGDLDTPHLAGLATALAARRHLVVRVDQPWRAAGRAVPPPPHRAVPGYVAVAAAARRVLAPRRPWVVGGHSNGARIATHALASDHGLRAIAALLVSYPLHRPGRPDEPRTEHWSGIDVPALVLQGTHDPFGGGDEVRRHLSLLPTGSEVVDIAGADHSFAVPRTRNPGGGRRAPADVAAELGEVVADWIDAR